MHTKRLEQTHPEYNRSHLARLRALYAGGQVFHALIGEFLPKNQEEPDDIWTLRQRQAPYINYAGSAINFFGSWLFVEPPVVTGLDDGWLQDVDRQGSSWPGFWQARIIDAQVGKRAWIWVDAPERPPGVDVQTRADEERLGLTRLYLKGIPPENVIDWGYDAQGALKWVIVRELRVERQGLDSDRSTVWRWTYIDNQVIRRFEWTPSKEQPAPTEQSVATELPQITHSMGRLPVFCLELPDGLWTANKLHDPAVSAFRQRAALQWALNRSAYAMPVLKRKWGGDAPRLGSGYYLPLETDDTFEWTEPPGRAYEALDKEARTMVEELHRVVHQMAQSVSSDRAAAQARSAASKQADSISTEIVLAEFARLVLDAMRAVLALVADRMAPGAKVTVAGLDGWQQEELSTLLEQVTQTTGLGVPSPTLKRSLYKQVADRMLPDVPADTRATIHKEIDSADLEESWPTPQPSDAP